MHLTEDRVTELVKDTLSANMVGRHDRTRELVHELMSAGDCEDWWLFTVGLCAVIATTLPKPCCEEHQTLSFGIAHVQQDGSVDPGEMFGGLSPQMETEHPDLVAFLRMLVAEASDDTDTSLAVFRVALQNNLACEVMDRALYAATQALITIRSGSN